jgi:hypothetical protein
MTTEITQAPISEISPEGDVIFVLGQNKRLRVCSVILRNASKPFNRMLGKDYAEGQNLSKTNPPEVPLPDDDPDAMEIIFNIIHHRNDAIPASLTPQEVFNIAIPIHKYDCVVALKHASIVWLKLSGNECLKDLGYLMGAAYILGDAEAFNDITLAMILRHKESYLKVFQDIPELDDHIPRDTMCKYEPKCIMAITNDV